MCWLFASGGLSTVTSASASILPMNIQSWFPLELNGLISLLSEGLSRVFSSTTVWKHQFFSAQPSLWSKSHIHVWLYRHLWPGTWLIPGVFVLRVTWAPAGNWPECVSPLCRVLGPVWPDSASLSVWESGTDGHHLLFWDQQWHQGYNSVDWYWQQLSMAPHYWFMLSVNDLRDPWSLLWLQAWKHSLPDCLWALGWGRGWLSLWLRQKQQPLHSGPGSWGSETTTSSELTQAPSRLNSGLFILCYYFILE